MRADFDLLAERYDELRPLDASWRLLLGRLVELADLSGRSVLDVGCGTGRLAAELATGHGCAVTGVDVSAGMLAVAARRVPAGVALVRAAAESLPFADGAFERATLWLVAHHLDGSEAFRELRRVLAPGGRAGIVSGPFAVWSCAFFPSLERVERGRGGPDTWADELRAAGFARTSSERVPVTASCTREEALARLRGRYTSSLLALSDDELAAGIRRAEQELPDRVADTGTWTVLVADAD